MDKGVESVSAKIEKVQKFKEGPVWMSIIFDNGVEVMITREAQQFIDDDNLQGSEFRSFLYRIFEQIKIFRDEVREDKKSAPIGRGKFGSVFLLPDAPEIVIKEDTYPNSTFYSVKDVLEHSEYLSNFMKIGPLSEDLDLRIVHYYGYVHNKDQSYFDFTTNVDCGDYEIEAKISSYWIMERVGDGVNLAQLTSTQKSPEADAVINQLIDNGIVANMYALNDWVELYFYKILNYFYDIRNTSSMRDFSRKNIVLSIKDGKPVFTLVDL